MHQADLFADEEKQVARPSDVKAELRGFTEFGTETRCEEMVLAGAGTVPVFINEFWTAKQRAAHSLHEVSYRACFKPQLPRFFIERLTQPGAVVYDPFLGRGTTLLEAALLGRVPWGCDINPLSRILLAPRLLPPTTQEVLARLEELDLEKAHPEAPEDLLTFYHPEVLASLANLREHFSQGNLSPVDQWIRMVATNRLTGHSVGYFSVYTLPPNQAVSVQSQLRINEKRNQVPPPRNVRGIIAKKSRGLLADLTAAERTRLSSMAGKAQILTASCDATPELPDASVDLVVTSPPFLTEVNYKTDNWLRCWFNGLDAQAINIWQMGRPAQWQAHMTEVLRELHRVLKPGGHIAFEVGEVRKKSILLEDLIAPAGLSVGLEPQFILINSQEFTKTSNCWGVSNDTKGTNTNRVVVFKKP